MYCHVRESNLEWSRSRRTFCHHSREHRRRFDYHVIGCLLKLDCARSRRVALLFQLTQFLERKNGSNIKTITPTKALFSIPRLAWRNLHGRKTKQEKTEEKEEQARVKNPPHHPWQLISNVLECIIFPCHSCGLGSVPGGRTNPQGNGGLGRRFAEPRRRPSTSFDMTPFDSLKP